MLVQNMASLTISTMALCLEPENSPELDGLNLVWLKPLLNVIHDAASNSVTYATFINII